jgi:hypothetical protein
MGGNEHAILVIPGSIKWWGAVSQNLVQDPQSIQVRDRFRIDDVGRGRSRRKTRAIKDGHLVARAGQVNGQTGTRDPATDNDDVEIISSIFLSRNPSSGGVSQFPTEE